MWTRYDDVLVLNLKKKQNILLDRYLNTGVSKNTLYIYFNKLPVCFDIASWMNFSVPPLGTVHDLTKMGSTMTSDWHTVTIYNSMASLLHEGHTQLPGKMPI